MRLILCLSIFVAQFIGHVAPWSYGDLDKWPELCQTGLKQSPIGLWKKTATKTSVPPLVFQNYNNCLRWFIANKGYTVEVRTVDSDQDNIPKLSGGNLGEYILDSIHFHWKSEHTINGRRFPLEAHLVHYKAEYENVTDASNNSDGLVVLTVMFEVNLFENLKLKKIADATKIIAKDTNKPTEISDLMVEDILPDNKRNFYIYEGSLTTPDCNEAVTFIVFEKTLHIGWNQLKQLSNVETSTGELLKENFRPLQKLNGRKVFYSQE